MSKIKKLICTIAFTSAFSLTSLSTEANTVISGSIGRDLSMNAILAHFDGHQVEWNESGPHVVKKYKKVTVQIKRRVKDADSDTYAIDIPSDTDSSSSLEIDVIDSYATQHNSGMTGTTIYFEQLANYPVDFLSTVRSVTCQIGGTRKCTLKNPTSRSHDTQFNGSLFLVDLKGNSKISLNFLESK